MEECRKPYLHNIFFRNAKRFCYLISDEKCPYAMFKSGVVRTGKRKVSKTKLLYAAQACHLRGIDYEVLKTTEVNTTVYGVDDGWHYRLYEADEVLKGSAGKLLRNIFPRRTALLKISFIGKKRYRAMYPSST